MTQLLSNPLFIGADFFPFFPFWFSVRGKTFGD